MASPDLAGEERFGVPLSFVPCASCTGSFDLLSVTIFFIFFFFFLATTCQSPSLIGAWLFGTLATPGAVLALSLPPNPCSSSWVKCFSHRTMREVRSCLGIDTTCGNKLRAMYSSRSRLFRPGVFLLVTNLLVHLWARFPRDILGACLCWVVLCSRTGFFHCQPFLCSQGDSVPVYWTWCTGDRSR